MITDLDWQKSIGKVLEFEGGYVNHPLDSAGATNKGIVQNTYNEFRTSLGLPTQSVLHIETSEIYRIYKNEYWNKVVRSDMSGAYACVLFDLAVNSGANRAAKFDKIANGDVKKLIEMRRDFFKKIVANNPSQSVFLKGWLSRIDQIEKYVAAWDLITF